MFMRILLAMWVLTAALVLAIPRPAPQNDPLSMVGNAAGGLFNAAGGLTNSAASGTMQAAGGAANAAGGALGG